MTQRVKFKNNRHIEGFLFTTTKISNMDKQGHARDIFEAVDT